MCCLVCRRRKPDVKTITWEAEEESKCELVDLLIFVLKIIYCVRAG